MYTQTAQLKARKKRSGSRISNRSRQQGTGEGRAKVRLAQLLICLVLFCTVYIGKGVFPRQLETVGDNFIRMVSANTDFAAAFSSLGQALSERGSVLGEIGAFCVEVFGGSEEQVAVPVVGGVEEESRFLSSAPDRLTLASHYLRQDTLSEAWFSDPQEDPAAEGAVQEMEGVQEIPVLTPPLGTVIKAANYTGAALPENYSMDWISLGNLEITTPVFGVVRSTYGYRDHPINGEYKFHGGVDIGGQTGDHIGAFAAGTVEYIGEDDSYGLYLKIDHGNGVKSFYAHCSKILVQAGQTVAIGETIAEVGSTGTATGPHLHLELWCGDTHLDPIYYIEYKTE